MSVPSLPPSFFRLLLRAALVLLAGALACGSGDDSPPGSSDASPPGQTGASPNGAWVAPVAGQPTLAGAILRLADRPDAMRYSLAQRSVPEAVAQQLAASEFWIRGERLSRPCFESIVFPALRLSWWLCRTVYPTDVSGRSDFRAMIAEPGSEEDRFRMLREADGAALTRGAIERAEDLGTWIPTRRGFTLPVPHAQKRGPDPAAYRVDYPVDRHFLSDFDPSHAQLSPAFVAREVEIGGDLRRSLYAPAPSQLRFSVVIPEDARLNLAVGVLEEAWFLSDGVEFEVALRLPDGEVATLSRKALDPRTQPVHRRWTELELDLSAYAGQRAELLFSTRPGSAGNPDFDFAAFGAPVLYGVPPDPTPVVLVDLDTLRADHLELYGYERATSPRLTEFAEDAVVFEQAIAQAPWTLPSQISILTGLYPATHRVRGLDQRLGDDAFTLARALGDAGYLTRALTDAGSMAHEFGFQNGFDSYWQTERHRHDYLPGLKRRFRQWFDLWSPENFFLLLHTYEPHEPYAPPLPDLDRFDSSYVGTVFSRFAAQGGKTLFDASEREREHLVARYDGEIRYTDRAFGEIMDMLRARGLYDRALIAVVSDHGEEFGEHGGWLHGHSFYDELLHVPLLIKFPRGTIAPTRVAQQVEMVDLLPTILDFLDLPAAEVDGRSLLPMLLAPEEGGLTPEQWAVGDEYAISDRKAAASVSVRTAKHKLVQQRGERRFYDLTQDPAERQNRYDPEDPTVKEFVAVLEAYLAGERAADAPPTVGELSPDLRDHLRALGYTE